MKRKKAENSNHFTAALNVRCTQAQRHRFDKLAAEQGLSTSTWARMILVRISSELTGAESKK